MDVSRVGNHGLYQARGKVVGKTANTLTGATMPNANQSESSVTLNVSREGWALSNLRNSVFLTGNSVLEKLFSGELKNDEVMEYVKERIDPLSLLLDDDENILKEIEHKNPGAAEEIKWDYLNRLYYGIDISSESIDFKDYAAKYASIRAEIEARYSGDEMEQRLKWLDETYDKFIERRAEEVTNRIQSRIVSAEIRRKTWEKYLAGKSGDATRYNYEEIAEPYKDFLREIKKSLIYFGIFAKQYIIDGNASPVAKEDKESFDKYFEDILNMKNA